MKHFKPILAIIATIIIVFVAVSLLDILLASLYPRFYSKMLFIISFGVGGIFAAILGYMYGKEQAAEKSKSLKWELIAVLTAAGFIFFFLLSKMEGGEYEPAFRAFGVMLGLGSLLFLKD